jgi:predicted transcriptional regulator
MERFGCKETDVKSNLFKLKNMKRRILVERGEVKSIAKIMGCTPNMVSYSLAFSKNSFLARKIRKAAIERGGIDTGELVVEQGKKGGAL